MNKYLFFILFLFAINLTFAQENEIINNDSVYANVEIMPSWMGCEAIEINDNKFSCTVKHLHEYLAKNTKYPNKAKRKNITGTVYISFVVNKAGAVVDTKIERGVEENLNKEALRVISSMPNWNPGMQRGKYVNVSYNIPVKFSLQNAK